MDKTAWNKLQEIVGKGLRNNSFLNDGLGDFTEYYVEKTDKVVSHTILFNGVELRVELMQDPRNPARFVVGYAQWVDTVFRWGGAYTLDADSEFPYDEALYYEIEELCRCAYTVVTCAAYEHPLTPREFTTGTRVVKPTSRYSAYRALHERMKYELNREYEEA